jgi:hypothetical protein
MKMHPDLAVPPDEATFNKHIKEWCRGPKKNGKGYETGKNSMGSCEFKDYKDGSCMCHQCPHGSRPITMDNREKQADCCKYPGITYPGKESEVALDTKHKCNVKKCHNFVSSEEDQVFLDGSFIAKSIAPQSGVKRFLKDHISASRMWKSSNTRNKKMYGSRFFWVIYKPTGKPNTYRTSIIRWLSKDTLGLGFKAFQSWDKRWTDFYLDREDCTDGQQSVADVRLFQKDDCNGCGYVRIHVKCKALEDSLSPEQKQELHATQIVRVTEYPYGCKQTDRDYNPQACKANDMPKIGDPDPEAPKGEKFTDICGESKADPDPKLCLFLPGGENNVAAWAQLLNGALKPAKVIPESLRAKLADKNLKPGDEITDPHDPMTE